jgi:hypothetical protein
MMWWFISGKHPRYPLNGSLGGPKRCSGPFGEEKNLLLLPGIEPRFFDSSALNPISHYNNYAILAPSYICTAVLLFAIHKM